MGHICVDCYLRSASLAGPLDETLATVQGLVDDGTIDEVAVHTWPSTVVLSEETEHTDVVDTFRTFEAWAAQWNVSIEPPFGVESRTSRITGDEREVLVTPVLCLAVSVNGALREVFPHHADDTTYTVEDALTALAQGAVTVDTELTQPLTTPDDHCPWCEVPLETGQGLYACPDCDWVGIATGPGEYRQYRPASLPADASGDPTSHRDRPLQQD